jgi:hypothetical protein
MNIFEAEEKISQYDGVFWNKGIGRWYVQIILLTGIEPEYFGSFDDEKEAGKKVNQICEKHGIPLKNPGIGTIPNQQRHVIKLYAQ